MPRSSSYDTERCQKFQGFGSQRRRSEHGLRDSFQTAQGTSGPVFCTAAFCATGSVKRVCVAVLCVKLGAAGVDKGPELQLKTASYQIL